MGDDVRDLRTALVEAFQATDSETAWFLDRRRTRVVTVRRGVVSDPLLRPRDVEDDEIRFVEIPAVTEAEVHDWMDAWAEETGDPRLAACIDHRAGANARFEERLARVSADAPAAWHRYRHARIVEVVDAWAAAVLAEHVPGGETGPSHRGD